MEDSDGVDGVDGVDGMDPVHGAEDMDGEDGISDYQKMIDKEYKEIVDEDEDNIAREKAIAETSTNKYTTPRRNVSP